ncbi:MAG: Crp/Fnr family transcriptional regulator [Deltaproteobacteria bacterium]|mgnify:CR=1 FL=1|nr:Crp/Fnr family transcriptional regulator [Deltaproteobacteria bacterium]RLB90496.1 MAG: Crp/Fnr family transcriptional regulator [Deltaproteobacteria bacterium]RLB95199.1 MAG: Crp/Fnr family transcriptional regulator [Deltaproteobacteria bacterium]RLC10000.1 MAG: Crp/Fnr family transcriptional regulator [Deltaproteobacteria bacterium]
MSSLEFLRQVPLFQSLSKADTEKLAAVLRRQSLKKGEALFRKGAEGTTLYIIAEGAIKIVLPSRMGSEVILAIFSEGDFFGEMALLDGRPRSADAVALSPCEVLALNRRDFLAFLKNNEEAIRSILYSLSMRLRKTDDLLEDTCFLNISGRFAKKLVELADTYGRREGDTILIDLRLSQKDMASMVGATRESINKEFRVLREKGLVSVTESTIRIHNLERLKRRIH